jgi:uncharacterized protein with HEPN domain
LPSERPQQRLADVIEQIDRICAHVADHTFEQYQSDQKTSDAVERCMSRVSEACSKLGTYLDALYPDTPWREMRGYGNVLRHRYEEIVHALIWKTIERDLPKIRASAVAELSRLQGVT